MKSPPKIKIDRNIPLPKARKNTTRYDLSGMQVGDSFAVPKEHGNSARVCAWRFAAKMGWEMTTRIVGANLRIWRVK